MDKVSVCFITYDRLQTLLPIYAGFLENTSFPRKMMELIVCDDSSPRPVQNQIRSMDFDKYLFNEKRKGLGNNQNNGVKAAANEFILQIQDDWECLGPENYLHVAIEIMRAYSHVGMIILKPRHKGSPVKERIAQNGLTVRVFDNEPGRKIRNVGEGSYTDWPHLKRREFHEAIGYYDERKKMWEMELDFCQRVANQKKYYVADIEELDAFRHIGEEYSYNTGNWRNRVAKRLAQYSIGRVVVASYLILKKYFTK